MPPVAAAAVAALAPSLTASFFATGTLVFGMTNIIAGASSLVLGVAQRALAPKSKKVSTTNRGGQTTAVRQPISSHKIVYGQRLVSGAITFMAASSDNLYLHLVVILAGHEVDGIGEVMINDTSIPPDALDAVGNVVSGRYSGKARIRKYLGTAGQAADPLLIAEVPEWTVKHRNSGRAYLYIRLEYNSELFPGGLPNIGAVVRGRKLYDPRDGGIRFSANAALMAYDYLTDSKYGFEAIGSVDSDTSIAAANICDEYVTTTDLSITVSSVDAGLNLLAIDADVMPLEMADRVRISTTGTLPGGLSAGTDYYAIIYQYKGIPRLALASSLANAQASVAIDITSAGTGTHTITKNGEPRYHGAGITNTSQALGENLIDILSAFGAKAVYAGGMWRLLAAAYTAPTVSFDERHMTGAIVVQSKLSRKERFNRVSGVYDAAVNNWQPWEYPVVDDLTAQENDGEVIKRSNGLDLPFTNRATTAQRLAKIEVRKASQDIAVQVPMNLAAMQAQAGENIMLSATSLGWTNKVFEVTGFKFNMGGDSQQPTLGVDLVLRETGSGVFSWSNTDERVVDIAPNTNLPNGFVVEAVQGLSFDSVPNSTASGDIIYTLAIQWTQHTNAFVVHGGEFEVQYKLSTEVAWRPSFYVAGNMNNTPLGQGSAGQNYDIRIRAINNFGVPSNWQTLDGVSVETGGGIGSTLDLGDYTTAATTTSDMGDFTIIATTTNDLGNY